MIRAKRYLTALLILILCVSLTSCGFVQYIKYEEPNTSEDLSGPLSEKLQSLELFATLDICDESKSSEYRAAILDAKNELGECTTLSELDEIWEKKVTEILLIAIKSHINMGDYRESEQEDIREIVALYAKDIGALKEKKKIEDRFRDLEVEIYEVKVADECYADELSSLKKDLKRELNVFPEYPEYANAELEVIEAIVSEFSSKISASTTKESANSLFESYKEQLRGIPTKNELELLKKQKALIYWEEALPAFNKKHSLALEKDIEAILSSMKDADNSKAINLMGAKFIIDAATQIGSAAMPDIKSIVPIYLNNIVSADEYRKEHKKQISDIVESSFETIKSLDDVSEARSVLDNSKAIILSLPISDTLWEKEDKEFFETLRELYGENILDVPEKMFEASSYEELAAIIDFYAFYQIGNTEFLRDTFRVKLLYSYKTPTWEKNEVYWYCELIRSAVGITGYFEKTSSGDYFVITLIPYALSANTNASDGPVKVDRYDNLVQFTDTSVNTPRPDDFNDFAYLKKNTKKLSGIWNTQQLWYAFEHGYLPDVIDGSPAEMTLERAKTILRDIIHDGMTDEEKIFAIFNWIGENVIFDEEYTKYLYPEDRDSFPDELAATLRAFHAEGALFDNLAVCEGFAKAMIIMLRIEGIESYRLFIHGYTDNAINNLGYDGYGSHALVAIKMSDGKFYISDPYEAYQHNTPYPKFHQFLIPWELHTTFVGSWSQIFKDLVLGEAMLPSVMDSMIYNGRSVFVKTEQELIDILNDFKNEANTKICVSVFESEGRTAEELKVAEKLTELGITYHKVSYKGLDEYILYKN